MSIWSLILSDARREKSRSSSTKVLEKFFQEDYHKSGSGIGLAISNEIVKLHKGKLILESQKGEGTCITFTLKNNLMDAIAEEKMWFNHIFFL